MNSGCGKVMPNNSIDRSRTEVSTIMRGVRPQ